MKRNISESAIELMEKMIEACRKNRIEEIINLGDKFNSCHVRNADFQLNVINHIQRVKVVYKKNNIKNEVKVLLGILLKGLEKHTHIVGSRRVGKF